jgi:GT2 family glycosyltransferase
VVNNATGKYIIWVDSDMQLSRDFVKMQTNFMEKNPNVGVAKGSYGLYDANLVSTLENLEFVTTNSERMRELDRNPLGTGGCIYRVKAINEVGGFNESITGSGEDADAEHRLKKKGWIFEQTNAIFFEMRRTTWQSLWEEYFWHGKGSLRITKGQTPTTLFKFLPPVAFFVECIRIVVAYKLTRRKIAILLPFHYAFKRTAWLAGLLHARFS